MLINYPPASHRAMQAEILCDEVTLERLQKRALKLGMTVIRTCRQGFVLQAPGRLFCCGDVESAVKQLIQLARTQKAATKRDPT